MAGEDSCGLCLEAMDVGIHSIVRVVGKKGRLSRQKRPTMLAWQWRASGLGTLRLHKACFDELLMRGSRSAGRKRQRGASDDRPEMTKTEMSVFIKACNTAEIFNSKAEAEALSKAIAEQLQQAKHAVVFSGAGISTAAGIGDYRGPTGKWTMQDLQVSDDDEDHGVDYENLRPTYTHEAIALLVKMGLIKYVISQNCDGLHALSGVPADCLSSLHGDVFVERCATCGHRYQRRHYVCYDAELTDEELTCATCGLSHHTLRKCTTKLGSSSKTDKKKKKVCNGPLLDTIINFGDNLEEPVLLAAESHAKKADFVLSMGSSMTVTPASELVAMGDKPAKLAIVNRQETDFDDTAAIRAFADTDQIMAMVMRNLLPEDELKRWEQARVSRMKQYAKQRDI